MVRLRPNDDSEVIVEEDLVDLSRASFSESLSSSDIDEDEAFHVTFDRVLFKSPNEIISRVLDANGYMVNLENILACFDNIKLGIKISGKRRPDETIAVKSYLPCFHFHLPNKSKVGPVLQKFYSEIETYQKKLNKLEKDPKKVPKSKDPDELQKQIKDLENENQELKSNLATLQAQLTKLTKAEASASRALVNQNIMPPNIRLAKVREIDLKQRMINLRAGRTNINFPMFLSNVLPEVDDKCLVYMEQGNVLGGFFYETKGRPIVPGIGKILWVENGVCKVRDQERRVWLLNSTNDIEIEMFSKLTRHDNVLLYIVDGHIVRIENLLKDKGDLYQEKLKEAFAMYQLLYDERSN